MQKLCSDQGIAERYGVSRSCVWRWVQQDILPAPLQISRGCTRFDIAKCDERVEQSEFNPKRIRKGNAAEGDSAQGSAQ